jgi:threonyl-tRNA synthetase
MSIRITFPDGSAREYPRGTTAYKVAEDISPRLAKDAVAARVSGVLQNLQDEILEDSSLEIITVNQPEGLEILRHSAAHVMAEAVKRLYPRPKLAIGPAIENGFYYDFDVPDSLFTRGPRTRIEAEMRKIVKEDQEFTHWELDRETAIKEFAAKVKNTRLSSCRKWKMKR